MNVLIGYLRDINIKFLVFKQFVFIVSLHIVRNLHLKLKDIIFVVTEEVAVEFIGVVVYCSRCVYCNTVIAFAIL